VVPRPRRWLVFIDYQTGGIAVIFKPASTRVSHRKPHHPAFATSVPQIIAVQDRRKCNDPCCKWGLCVPGTGIRSV